MTRDEQRDELEPELVVIASRALFDSPLWQTWCGEELHIVNEQGQSARIETARTVLGSVPSGWLKTDDGWVKFEAGASCENYCGFCLVHDEPWPCPMAVGSPTETSPPNAADQSDTLGAESST